MEKQSERQEILTNDIRVFAKELQAIYSRVEIYYSSAVNNVILVDFDAKGKNISARIITETINDLYV